MDDPLTLDYGNWGVHRAAKCGNDDLGTRLSTLS
jgi:hypothetical protein